jgi:secreted trypsin-like serine protease
MLCAVDVDGRQPLSSGCFGDSGGPLIAGTNAAPIQLGVTSWGGDRCGADHSPSVFADVSRYRDFILDATPTWAPTQRYSAHIQGSARRGNTLKSDRGRRLFCFVTAYNDGGEVLVGVDGVRAAG